MKLQVKPLSKSKLLAYRQCERRLWLEVKQPELLKDSSITKVAYQVGNHVGELARVMYDPNNKGTLINPQEEGFKSAFARTATLLKKRNPIFEATFAAKGALALADIMLPANQRGKIKWHLIEVKSSTQVKDYHHDDVAIQAYIAKHAGIDLKGIKLVCIDNSFVYQGKKNYLGLLKEKDLSDEAFAREAEVKEWVKQAHEIIRKRKEPIVDTGEHCNQPYTCGFYQHCSKHEAQAEFPVQWLPRIQAKKLKSKIIDNEIIDMCDLPDKLLNKLQKRVKDHTLSGKTYFDKQGARKELARYKQPAYFLDFESIQFAVPIWKGTRPYQQLIFQYSLHKLNRNNKVSHKAFLDMSGKDPSLAIAKALINDCGKIGPVFVYHQAFEKARIKELAKRFPKLRKQLLAINKRIVDLLPIARKYYYHPSQQGSWSLKKVLPAIAPDLQYSDLDGVQDGGMAMEAYLKAIDTETSTEQKKIIHQQLLSYCELDTLALIRIWQWFTGNKVI